MVIAIIFMQHVLTALQRKIHPIIQTLPIPKATFSFVYLDCTNWHAIKMTSQLHCKDLFESQLCERFEILNHGCFNNVIGGNMCFFNLNRRSDLYDLCSLMAIVKVIFQEYTKVSNNFCWILNFIWGFNCGSQDFHLFSWLCTTGDKHDGVGVKDFKSNDKTQIKLKNFERCVHKAQHWGWHKW